MPHSTLVSVGANRGSPHADAALIFDENYSPKLAYRALIEFLRQPVEVRQ
ncbi:MAG: hypothetical protein F6J93_38100 [Oscillatoria sp. SIO1A7]|nr:hypothetical protein [Oscillatoria sp. SIO1A7]